MPAPASYDYAYIRVVPRVEREEFLNAGIILFARTARFLDARLCFDEQRFSFLFPIVDVKEIRRHLDLFPVVARGGANAGPIGKLDMAERFHWLVSPRSSVVQVSQVHCGVSDDPAAALDHLVKALRGEG